MWMDILMGGSLIALAACIVLSIKRDWGIAVYFWWQNLLDGEKEFWKKWKEKRTR